MCRDSSFLQQWRIWIRPLLIILYVLFVIIILPLLIVKASQDGFTKNDQLVLIGGLFVLTSLPISFWHITQHIIHFTKPILQKHIVRILWMVPIYALNAWLSLLFPSHSIFMDSIRECYEAYVIYNFMVYLLNYLNLEMDLEANLEFKPPVKHIFPLCYMTPWRMGREFVHNCKHGILQYTVVRPLTTFISVICEINHVYGEGTFQVNVAFPYIIAINNVSQIYAMYCLVLFYKANNAELKPMRPLPKFLCIKAVVFFSFFQGVIINILVYFGYLQELLGIDTDDDYQNLAAKLQNFLICIEMLLAAFAHHYSFPHYPFHINIPYYAQNGPWYNAFLAMLDISDVHQDVSDHIGVVGSSLSRRFRGRSMYHMPRGSQGNLIYPSGSAPSLYQSGSNYTDNVRSVTNTNYKSKTYGSTILTSHNPNSGINIVNQNKRECSPKHGQPKNINLFNFEYSLSTQTSNSNTDNNLPSNSKLNSEKSDYNISTKSDTTATTSSENDDGKLKKSDSNTSDWLSTPTDEMLGIDVKGIGNDKINIRDPNI